MEDYKCKDGGDCGLGGFCPDCKHNVSASGSNDLLCVGDTGAVYMYLTKTDQVGIFVETTREGVRVKNIGVVPYSEIRVATLEEVNNYYI